MKTTRAFICAAALSLWLSGAASAAPILYSNGPISGTGLAWEIDGGGRVFNRFTFATQQTVGSVNFGLITTTGQTITTVDFSFQADTGPAHDPLTTPVTLTTVPVSAVFSGVATNPAFDVYQASFTLPTPLTLAAGTYWFGLENAVGSAPLSMFWDINNGPSLASVATVGNTSLSNSFQLIGTPELDPSAATLPFAFMAFSLLAVGSRRKTSARPLARIPL